MFEPVVCRDRQACVYFDNSRQDRSIELVGRPRHLAYLHNVQITFFTDFAVIMSLTQEQSELKARCEAELGPTAYDSSWARMLKHSPDMFAASVRLASVPKKTGHLIPKVQSLISLAVSASSTHLHLPSIHRHTKAALANGASTAEIVEVLALTATLGIHATTTGVPVLVEVLEEQGKALPKGLEGMSKEQLAQKADFEKKRGYWNTMWEDVLRLNPEFFDAYTEFSSVPWVNEGGKGALEPKVSSS